ncbi:MAG: hypothetical protein V7642_668 [Burkholderiales bacterium]|jgi:hypothetical protein
MYRVLRRDYPWHVYAEYVKSIEQEDARSAASQEHHAAHIGSAQPQKRAIDNPHQGSGALWLRLGAWKQYLGIAERSRTTAPHRRVVKRGAAGPDHLPRVGFTRQSDAEPGRPGEAHANNDCDRPMSGSLKSARDRALRYADMRNMRLVSLSA